MPELLFPVLFIRVGWLTFYNYDVDEYGPIGGGAYNEDDVGSEAENFQRIDGRCYGYAQTGKIGGYNLFRCWPRAEQHKNSISGALVVMVARRPEGGQVIIGWYKNATVYAAYKDRQDLNDKPQYGIYNCEADADDCLLLPTVERKFAIPKGAGGMGQANVFYCFDDEGQLRTHEWIGRAIEYVEKYSGPNLLLNPDLERVDRLAIARAYCEGQVKSRELDDETALKHLGTYLAPKLLTHLSSGSWPVYAQIANLMHQGKGVEAFILYQWMMIDDNGVNVAYDTPYLITPENGCGPVPLCNAVPMIPRSDLSNRLEKDESVVAEDAVSETKYALTMEPFAYRKLREK